MNKEEHGICTGEEEIGYRKLIVWQNAKELRKKIYDFTKKFPAIEVRRVSQMRDAARSVKQNIQEGYCRNSLGDYIRSLEISRGSLGELMGDLDDCFEDELINQESFQSLRSLCIKTKYLLDRLLTSLDEKKKSGTWKKRWAKASILNIFFVVFIPYSSFFFLLIPSSSL